MVHTRQNVWELGKKWADPILWYAKGVAAMKSRPITEPTSWRFFAAIHGIVPELWHELGHLGASEKLPGAALKKKFWKQCQHGTWYFLPWHRGYLLAVEANIRAAVVELGGPADWALPYWNYFKTGQSGLPVEFASAQWPGAGTNPLYVQQRYGPKNDSKVYVPVHDVNLQAMHDHEFTGVGVGGSPGFGGVDTGFSHSGTVHGALESQPHDWVHGLTGGSNPKNRRPGLMSDPDTAALDPIFWLHHANIDRLWASWNHDTGHTDPKQSAWLAGPGGTGRRKFAMPMPDGSTWVYTPKDMMKTATLGYRYDELAPGREPRAARARRVALAAPHQGGATVPSGPNVQLAGANDQTVTVRGPASTVVRLDSGSRQRLAADLASVAAEHDTASAPTRVFLNLENVRGRSDAAAFHVYVGVPAGQDVDAHPDLLAGSISPFGLRKATATDDEHAGQGLTFVLDITVIVEDLQAQGSFGTDDLPVRIVPVTDLPDDDSITIGRISVYRQGD